MKKLIISFFIVLSINLFSMEEQEKPSISKPKLSKEEQTALNNKLIQAIRSFREPDLQEIRTLLEQGANPNIKDTEETGIDPRHLEFRSGNPMLNLAVFKGWGAIVKLLLQNHANPNGKNRLGNTPLIVAVEQAMGRTDGWKWVPIIRDLLSYGANPDLRNDVGESARTLSAGFTPDLLVR